MSYRLSFDQPVRSELHRVAVEQLDEAIATADGNGGDLGTRVHEIRKRCKKLRGLLRLMRPALRNTYQKENAALRDAANLISATRDLYVLPQTYDALIDVYGEQLDRTTLGRVRQRLEYDVKRQTAPDSPEYHKLSEVTDRLRDVRMRLCRWPLPESAEDLMAGLERVYRRTREALADVLDDATVENLHELRKRTKYHWYHCRLLRDLWRQPLEARAAELSRLNDLLGEDHDLATFTAKLREDPRECDDLTSREVLTVLAEQRREQLQVEIRDLAAHLLAEKPKHFRERLTALVPNSKL